MNDPMMVRASTGAVASSSPSEAVHALAIPDTDLVHGLTAEQVEVSRRRLGSNRFTELTRVTFWERFVESLKDDTLKILMAAAGISIVLGMFTGQFVEGVAILVAVAIASLVGTINEHQKDREFVALNRVKEDRLVRVVRGGRFQRVSIHELVVGDLVEIETGDKIPADGILARGVDVRVNQSSLTGESQDVAIDGRDIRLDSDRGRDLNRRRLLGETIVTAGYGVMLLTAVGDSSEFGKLRRDIQQEDAPTPLQERLSALADKIGKVGLAAAIVTFVALAGMWLWRGEFGGWVNAIQTLVGFAVIAITIVVVAVPEGLPLAVTASLAYSVRRMQKDMNLVRRLMACETMGAATLICSDKTGTLTENRMTVAAAWFGGRRFDQIPSADGVPQALRERILEVAAINSTSLLERKNGVLEYVGSPTECALLRLVEHWGADYLEMRGLAVVVHQLPFTSDRKRMTTLVAEGAEARVLVKGAPEVVLERCDRIAHADGERALGDADREQVMSAVVEFASRAYRTLALAYRGANLDCDPEDSERALVLLGIVGIEDPVRDEVSRAIAQCRSAGIGVKMVTGDHRATAEAAAGQIGLMTSDGIVMEGPEFRALSDEELDVVAPRIRVLARSTPSDKLRLVRSLKRLGEVVAVTGDGTNDGPALKEADVGLSMGKYGTEVAKEASDIVILDDNFASIVKSVVWGRTIFENIRKFLQFQLTVNLVALATAFFGALLGFGTPLTAVQLLWVNLIMDTLAALALGLEPPDDRALVRPPHGRHAPLITRAMWFNIVAMGTLMFGILMLILNSDVIVSDRNPAKATILFNVFVFFQFFNELNCRTTSPQGEVLSGLSTSRMFIAIVGSTMVIQCLIVQFGGAVFRTVPLGLGEWLLSVGLAALALPFGWLVRFFGRGPLAGWLRAGAERTPRPAVATAGAMGS